MDRSTANTVWVPCDAAAVSVGADDVAAALAQAGVTVRRNGSRGMLWLEPLVEVEQADPDGTTRRIGYPNATAGQVHAILDGSAESIGVVDEHEWLARQNRVTFARVGVIEPTDALTDLDDTNCWLGKSHSDSDPIAIASYNDVRIWSGALSHEDIELLHDLGPDA